ncbi:hypothetical protein DFP72DRAFT_900923 [Ephemerocybe angulata]|uniref:Uncharacterized protein n=1 Tax=Ephemerocybe angulata TaxID=980116 RepID=A0A8H6M2X6_9AGAR|nr:hypothetical protein DFP72DRAFT_900923 [Tulosesus angulatus]
MYTPPFLVVVALLLEVMPVVPAKRLRPSEWVDELSEVKNTPASAKVSCPWACKIECPEKWTFVCPCTCLPPDDVNANPPPTPEERRRLDDAGKKLPGEA